MTGVQEGSNISSLNAGSNGNSVKDVDCYDISVMGIESSIVKWEGGLLWKLFFTTDSKIGSSISMSIIQV